MTMGCACAIHAMKESNISSFLMAYGQVIEVVDNTPVVGATTNLQHAPAESCNTNPFVLSDTYISESDFVVPTTDILVPTVMDLVMLEEFV